MNDINLLIPVRELNKWTVWLSCGLDTNNFVFYSNDSLIIADLLIKTINKNVNMRKFPFHDFEVQTRIDDVTDYQLIV